MQDEQNILCGNLTASPVVRRTKTSNKPVANLRIARNYPKNKDGSQRAADFFDVEVWDEMAENIAALPKGTRLIIIGRYKSDSWTSEDGTVHHGFRIVADEIGPSARWNPVFAGIPDGDDGPLDLPDDNDDF